MTDGENIIIIEVAQGNNVFDYPERVIAIEVRTAYVENDM